jgi:hypothetical protein
MLDVEVDLIPNDTTLSNSLFENRIVKKGCSVVYIHREKIVLKPCNTLKIVTTQVR